jgi:hypothetical protein
VRHEEVLAYLRTVNAEDEYWVAVDDLAGHYPDNVRLIVTNSYVGFDAIAASKLDALLQQGCIEP